MPTKIPKGALVSSEGPQDMSTNYFDYASKELSGVGRRKRDINLPADESQMDPRLKNRRDALRAIPESLRQLRKLGK